MDFGFEALVPYVLYSIGLAAFLLTILWKPVIGIFFLLPLIPLQTIRYRLNDFPLGQSVLGVMMLAVVLGLLAQGKPVLPKTPWTKLLCVYIIFTFVSLCLGSFYLGRSLPFPGDQRFAYWQEYITLPALLLLVAAVEPTKREMKIMVTLMCLATLVLDHNFWTTVSGRDFSSFSDDLRDGGQMGYAGVNGLGAFEAQVAAFLLALAAFESSRWLRLGYIALTIFSAVCLTYTLSRGGYIAFLIGWLFLGLVKQRSLLILLVAFICTWTSLVPRAVQQRVLMTYNENEGQLDHSSAERVALWEEALPVFELNPVIGVGFNTYAFTKHLDNYADTHNIYLKVLVETGIVGFLLFIWLLATTFWTGCRLFRRAKDPFLCSLGLALAGWLLCSVAANCFGDRWTFLQVNGYMWVLGGLVSQALVLEERSPSASTEGVGLAHEPVEVPKDLPPQTATVS